MIPTNTSNLWLRLGEVKDGKPQTTSMPAWKTGAVVRGAGGFDRDSRGLACFNTIDQGAAGNGGKGLDLLQA